MNCLFKVMPQHLNRIQVRTLTRPLQSLHFVFSSAIQRWTCWCVLDHCPAAEPKFASALGHEQMAGYSPSGFFGKQQNSWFHLSQQVFQVTKDPATTSKELQASLASVKVSVHDSSIRKRLGKNGLHGRVPRRKPLLSKKNIKARLSFARKHLDDPQDFWENTLWTDETKVELFGRCVSHYWTLHFKKRTSYQQ
uniref:Transposase Tc1-like domain-containing protein n=1 Tax=Cyprinus carpio carpio TaxID=630221 RepID=A0A9J7YV58_CYPCA